MKEDKTMQTMISEWYEITNWHGVGGLQGRWRSPKAAIEEAMKAHEIERNQGYAESKWILIHVCRKKQIYDDDMFCESIEMREFVQEV